MYQTTFISLNSDKATVYLVRGKSARAWYKKKRR
jgi:hypothetical protein